MKKNKQIKFPLILIFGDILILSSLFLFLLFQNYKGIGLTLEGFVYISLSYIKEYLIIIFSWLILAGYTKIYNISISYGALTFIKKSTIQFFIFSLIIMALSNTGNSLVDLTIKQLLVLYLLLFSFLTASRILYSKILNYKASKGQFLRDLIIVGTNDNTHDFLKNIIGNKVYSYNLIQIFSNQSRKEKNYSGLRDLEKFLTFHKIDYALISLGGEISDDEIAKIIDFFEKKYIEIGFIPNSIFERKQTLHISYLDTFPILTYKKHPLDNSFNQITKRIFDLVFTLLVFTFLLSWLMPLIAIAVFITQGRPIFFSQKRNGLNGKEFDCLKFRTMIPHKYNSVKPTERNDPRVTRLGRILRKTSLDELPQFINVLKGEMSIVGPRPHMVSENESYSDIIKRYSLRHYVKPGITGLAQVKGYRGAVDTEKDMEMRIRTDIYYVRNWSFLLDLFIIYKTAKLMIFGDENAI